MGLNRAELTLFCTLKGLAATLPVIMALFLLL